MNLHQFKCVLNDLLDFSLNNVEAIHLLDYKNFIPVIGMNDVWGNSHLHYGSMPELKLSFK